MKLAEAEYATVTTETTTVVPPDEVRPVTMTEQEAAVRTALCLMKTGRRADATAGWIERRCRRSPLHTRYVTP